MERLGLPAKVGIAALFLGAVLVVFWLPGLPEGAQIDLSWTQPAAFAVPVLSFGAIFWLRQIKGPVKLGTDPTMLASLAFFYLRDLVPDRGRHPVSIDTATDFAMVALILIGIILINLGEAWKKPGRNSPTNPPLTGIPA